MEQLWNKPTYYMVKSYDHLYKCSKNPSRGNKQIFKPLANLDPLIGHLETVPTESWWKKEKRFSHKRNGTLLQTHSAPKSQKGKTNFKIFEVPNHSCCQQPSKRKVLTEVINMKCYIKKSPIRRICTCNTSAELKAVDQWDYNPNILLNFLLGLYRFSLLFLALNPNLRNNFVSEWHQNSIRWLTRSSKEILAAEVI